METPIQCCEKWKNALNSTKFPQNRTVQLLGSGHRFLNSSQKQKKSLHLRHHHQNKRLCRKFDEPSANQTREKLSDVLTSEKARLAEKSQTCKTDSASYLLGMTDLGLVAVL